MLILAVRQDQIIAAEWLDPDEKINRTRYIQFLNEALRPYIEENFSPNEIAILEHDNARPHAARDTQDFIATMEWGQLAHPPYS